MNFVALTFQAGDIFDTTADVVAFKYAQDSYGIDYEMASKLIKNNPSLKWEDLEPAPGEYKLMKTNGIIESPYALFMGVVDLNLFRYSQIEEFGTNIIRAIATDLPLTKHLALTMHGAGYGLDEAEALASLLQGLKTGWYSHKAPLPDLQKITIVELDKSRLERLINYCSTMKHPYFTKKDDDTWIFELPEENIVKKSRVKEEAKIEKPKEKPYVFVAMPFKREFDDIYFLGIQAAVHANDMLCERMDMSTFTGDILSQTLTKIQNAKMVVAELTGANPNVYLEVGYAWASRIPTVLVAKDMKEVSFDLRGQRCISYERIIDLKDTLTNEINNLVKTEA